MYAYETLNSPLGPICIAEDPNGIICLHLGPFDEVFELTLLKLTQKDLSHFKHTGPYTTLLKKELEAYFDGRLTTFTVPLSYHGTDFQVAVWRVIATIPFGDLCTYGDIAKTLGKPMANRAVGGATGKNPIPIVVPCHRVVGSSGALTGFSAPGGLATKIKLLEREGIHYEL